MKSLEERILKTNRYAEGGELDVGDYLNRSMDTALLDDIAKTFAHHFEGEKITHVLTVESAGIGIATMTAHQLSAKALYALKKKSTPEKDAYVVKVSEKSNLTVSVPKKYLSPAHHVLIVDDFLGMGPVTNALIEIVRLSGARLVGVGVAVERKYLGGGDCLRRRGINLCSVVTIQSDDKENGIVFI